MASKCPDETLHMRKMSVNLCILRMFEDPFSLDVTQLMVMDYILMLYHKRLISY